MAAALGIGGVEAALSLAAAGLVSALVAGLLAELLLAVGLAELALGVLEQPPTLSNKMSADIPAAIVIIGPREPTVACIVIPIQLACSLRTAGVA